MEHTICFFEIPVGDSEAARAFYQRLFEWRFSEADTGGDRPYLFIQPSQRADALSGGLVPRLSEDHHPTVYVQVASIEEMLPRAEQAGATVLAGKTPLPGLGWVAVILDPDRNPVGLFQPAETEP
jgi:predicted enzyme related to lactoylglutathione lyase